MRSNRMVHPDNLPENLQRQRLECVPCDLAALAVTVAGGSPAMSALAHGVVGAGVAAVRRRAARKAKAKVKVKPARKLKAKKKY